MGRLFVTHVGIMLMLLIAISLFYDKPIGLLAWLGFSTGSMLLSVGITGHWWEG